jgi:transposase
LTETCDEDLPALITNVETTCSAVPHMATTMVIQKYLREKELLPQEHLVDVGW